VPVDQVLGIKRPIAGAQHLAIAEHDFQSAGESEMIEIGRIAGALVERVADHTALRRSRRHVQHQFVAAAHQFIIERLVADARLNHGKGELLVDIEDAVHFAAEIDHDLPGS
jgi:hypothetical protein